MTEINLIHLCNKINEKILVQLGKFNLKSLLGDSQDNFNQIKMSELLFPDLLRRCRGSQVERHSDGAT